MAKPRVLLLEKIHEVAVSQLCDAGFECESVGQALKEDELIARLKGVSLLGIRSKTQVTARVLERSPSLQAVGAFCIGVNQIDLDAARQRGVACFNAPFSNTRSVAELVIAEIVMLGRRIPERTAEMHRGQWRKLSAGASEVRGKTLGIVGYGHIGTQVSTLAEGLGMRVVFFDVAARLPLGNAQSRATLKAVLEESDFVTLHVPETPQTKGMIGAQELGWMKAHACLLNLSRGTVVDLEALAAALNAGRLGGAAVDVFPVEPEENAAEGFRTPLTGLGNVILTPHIGGSTAEAQEAIGREVARSFIQFMALGSTLGSVNLPQVELPQMPGAHRVVNIHKNVPGVLRDVNRLVSEQGANILGQTLSTAGEVGYLVMDLDVAVGERLVETMLQLPTTLRAWLPRESRP